VNALFSPFKRFKVDYSVIPWCTYTDPEVATVGHTEVTAKDAGIKYDITKYGIDDLDRAIADGNDYGFVKVLTAKGKDKIVGATIVGVGAGELLAEFVTNMKHGKGLNAILGTIHSYPTMGEANKFAAGNWKKENAPQNLLKWVQKYHNWRRS
jgi:pyruvate/2-oxoglutarate dehydrogenase complex dihydrolipoamide dehydrogenase (E3) component